MLDSQRLVFVQVFEDLGAITQSVGSTYTLDVGFSEDVLHDGAELFATDASTVDDINDAKIDSTYDYIRHGLVVTDAKTGEVKATESTFDTYNAYNFYNFKTDKLLASLPLVSCLHSSATSHEINVKFKGLDDRKVRLYFIKES